MMAKEQERLLEMNYQQNIKVQEKLKQENEKKRLAAMSSKTVKVTPIAPKKVEAREMTGG